MSRRLPRWLEHRTLQFRCTGCGDCCRQPGFVFFSREEADRVARRLLGDEAVAETLLGELWLEEPDGHFAIEVEGATGCPFLADGRCSIHDIKPRQCKTYPFWSENLTSEKRWNAEKRYCEGIDPAGDDYGPFDIVALLEGAETTHENR